jgi:transcription antitermination factor NusG
MPAYRRIPNTATGLLPATQARLLATPPPVVATDPTAVEQAAEEAASPLAAAQPGSAPLDRPPALPDAGHWAALHTRARAEKVVARWLAREGATHYVPQVRSRRTYGARVRISWIPLFPGYVFFDSATYDGRRAYQTHKVANVLVPKSPLILGPDLLKIDRAIHLFPDLKEGVRLTEVGTPVEVTEGPMMGTKGRFVRRERESLLVLTVDFIGFGAEVTIDEAFVKAA